MTDRRAPDGIAERADYPVYRPFPKATPMVTLLPASFCVVRGCRSHAVIISSAAHHVVVLEVNGYQPGEAGTWTAGSNGIRVRSGDLSKW